MTDLEKLEHDSSIMENIEELFNSLADYYGIPEDEFSDTLGGLQMLINHKLRVLVSKAKEEPKKIYYSFYCEDCKAEFVDRVKKMY